MLSTASRARQTRIEAVSATACTVRRAIGRVLHLRALTGAIADDASLRDRLAADSLDMIAIAASIEDDLDIAIGDDELASAVTVGDLVALAERKVAAR